MGAGGGLSAAARADGEKYSVGCCKPDADADAAPPEVTTDSCGCTGACTAACDAAAEAEAEADAAVEMEL